MTVQTQSMVPEKIKQVQKWLQSPGREVFIDALKADIAVQEGRLLVAMERSRAARDLQISVETQTCLREITRLKHVIEVVEEKSLDEAQFLIAKPIIE